MNRIITYKPYEATITIGLCRGYSKQEIDQAEVINELQSIQDALIKERSLYMSANCYRSFIVMSGQMEPHFNMNFIEYPKFKISGNKDKRNKIFKEVVEMIAESMMRKFEQNRIVIKFHDCNVMLEMTENFDPGIATY